MNYRAVLFDYDGVTADSPRMNYEAWRHAFSTVGVAIELEEYFKLEGQGPRQIAGLLCRRHGVDASQAELISQLKAARMSTYGPPRVYPEIPGILADLCNRGVATGLVTGAARARIDQCLPSNLREKFGVIVTSDDTEYPKPHPQPYMNAAASLEIGIQDTLVIENAPLGIASAKSGGFTCVALATTLSFSDLAAADLILPDHAALVKWLEINNNNRKLMSRVTPRKNTN